MNSSTEPALSCNRARVVIAGLKDLKKIDHNTLVRLVQKCGLPKHDDPYGSGHWCFRESEILAWFEARMKGDEPKRLPGPGRPRKEKV